MQLARYLAERRRWIDRELRRRLPLSRRNPLDRPVRYSLLLGGKRLRPILTLAAAEAVGADAERALPFACAIEMIHSYSLVHDDLPAMDDDDLRRGRPTTHKAFGEGSAILAGDALLTDAFTVAIEGGRAAGLSPAVVLDIVAELARAAGSEGMVGGQALDLRAEKQPVKLRGLETIHRGKTGALLRAAVRMGARAGGARPAQLAALTEYAESIGLAFQIVDDLLDAEGSEAQTGKRVGRDADRGKATFPALLGSDGSRRRAAALLTTANAALERFGAAAEPLRAIAAHIGARAGVVAAPSAQT